jgi:hypothetical protein
LLERIGVRKVTIHDVKISKLHTKIRSWPIIKNWSMAKLLKI